MYESSRTVSGLGDFYSNLKLDIMSTPSWQYGPSAGRDRQSAAGRNRIYGPSSYVLNAYTKPALMFFTLERYLGWETFRQILSTYFERWKFAHPLPHDFFDIADQVSGQVVEEKWQGAGRWIAFRYAGPEEIRTVQVDPKRILALDVNLTNNSWIHHS